MVILMIHNGGAKNRVEVLQTNLLTAVHTWRASFRTFPDNLWFCTQVVERNIALSPVKETMPFSVTERKTKFNLDFYTQLLKGHVCMTLDECLTTFHTVFK